MFANMSPQTQSSLLFFLGGAALVVGYKRLYGTKAHNKGALAMNYNGLALQANRGRYGAIHKGAIHLGNAHMGALHANPGYMSGIHLGGVKRMGMTNRRNVAFHG